jgi:hypothetical protein
MIGPALAWELVETFLKARFSGADRHQRRVEKVRTLEIHLVFCPKSSYQNNFCHPERTGPQTYFSLGVVSRRICGCFFFFLCKRLRGHHTRNLLKI